MPPYGRRPVVPQPEGEEMGMRESTQGNVNPVQMRKPQQGGQLNPMVPPPPASMGMFQPLPPHTGAEMVGQAPLDPIVALMRKLNGSA